MKNEVSSAPNFTVHFPRIESMPRRDAFIFAGFGNKILGRRVDVVETFLKKRGYRTHVFTDRHRAMFFLGCDSIPGRAEMLRHVRDRAAEADRSFAVGSSGGGLLGMRFSADAGIERFLGFSIFTTVDLASRQIDRRAVDRES